MSARPFKPLLFLSMLFLIIALACNFGSAPTPTPVPPTQPPTQPPVVQPTPEPKQIENPTKAPDKPTAVPASTDNLLITSIDDIQKAVVKIVVEGSFDWPEGWEVNAGYSGSGFVVDPSGIIVTNNHVVTGAAIVKVYFEGDDKAHSAKVLGASECSDLAVIKISDAKDLPYVKWYSGDIKNAMKVFAVGYPAGQFNMTDGIVSSTKYELNSTNNFLTSYNEEVIQHTARINHGSSGGPLVTEKAEVLGVNYAGSSSTDQNWAINMNGAQPVVDELQTGKDVDSIGINGMTLYQYYASSGSDPIYGIWVASVKAGSPADKSGIKPGDIIYHLGNEVLATDGSMKSYCEVIRSHNPGDTLDMAIIRTTDWSILEGQLNGRALEVTGYYGSGGSNNTNTNTNDACIASDTSGYIECVDDTSTILVDVPDTWTDYNGGKWTYDNEDIGVAISAAPNLDDFNNTVDSQGVFFGASDTFAKWGGYIQFLDYYTGYYSDKCKLDGRYDYNDGVYRGKYDSYYNCGGAGGNDAYVLTAVSIADSGKYIILIEVQVPRGETDVIQHILDTFVVGKF